MPLPLDPRAFPLGYRIDGRYEVRGALGQGANGVVYQVFDHYLQLPSALKLLLQGYNRQAPWHEAQVLAGLDGEFVLPVLNANHHLGLPYIVTEVAFHGTVANQTTPDVGVPTDQAIRWVQHACRGTARVHDRNLLHNDIKPDNLFLTAKSDALLGDLGLASLRDQSGHGSFGGTPSTMAPEVAIVGATVPPSDWPVHRPTSVQSDVYSLGATLYWVLSGQPPHHDPAGAVETMRGVVAGPPDDLLDVAPHVPLGVRDIVQKAMARDPADRYDGPAAFDAALGSRSTQIRRWTRVAPHPGHVSCFIGAGGTKKNLAVCVVYTGNATKHEVQVTHSGTGRSVKPWRVVRLAELARALRSEFRRLQ